MQGNVNAPRHLENVSLRITYASGFVAQVTGVCAVDKKWIKTSGGSRGAGTIVSLASLHEISGIASRGHSMAWYVLPCTMAIYK